MIATCNLSNIYQALTSNSRRIFLKLILNMTALCGMRIYFHGLPPFCVVKSEAFLQYNKAAAVFS